MKSACQEYVAIADKPRIRYSSSSANINQLYQSEDVHSRLGLTIQRSRLRGRQAAPAGLAKPSVDRM